MEKMSATAPEGQRGIAIFIGNAEAPAQYRDNCYKYRQDSTWLYYFGIDQPLYAAILDFDEGRETIYADDFEIGDIIWMGPQPSVQSVAESVGVAESAPYGALNTAVAKAIAAGRKVHYIRPSRYYNKIKISELIDCKPAEVDDKYSEALTKAII